MVKNIVLPGRQELNAMFIKVSNNFGLMSDLYPVLLDELAGKSFSKSEIERIVKSKSTEYLHDHNLVECLEQWMNKIALDIIEKLCSLQLH
jgi:hypothetical protein